MPGLAVRGVVRLAVGGAARDSKSGRRIVTASFQLVECMFSSKAAVDHVDQVLAKKSVQRVGAILLGRIVKAEDYAIWPPPVTSAP